jgi:hypothetical protein
MLSTALLGKGMEETVVITTGKSVCDFVIEITS